MNALCCEIDGDFWTAFYFLGSLSASSCYVAFVIDLPLYRIMSRRVFAHRRTILDLGRRT